MTPEQIQFRILAKAGDLEHASVSFSHRMCLPYDEKRGLGRRLGGRLRPDADSPKNRARRGIAGTRNLKPPRPGQKPIDGDSDGLIFDDTNAEQPAPVARAIEGVARGVARAARGLQQAREEDRDLLAEGLEAAARGIRRITGQETGEDRNRAREAVEDVARAVPETPARDRVRSTRKPKPGPVQGDDSLVDRQGQVRAVRAAVDNFANGELPRHLRRIQFTAEERERFGDRYTPANVFVALAGRFENGRLQGDTDLRLADGLKEYVIGLTRQIQGLELNTEAEGRLLGKLADNDVGRAVVIVQRELRDAVVADPLRWDKPPNPDANVPTPDVGSPRPNEAAIGAARAALLDKLRPQVDNFINGQLPDHLDKIEWSFTERGIFGNPQNPLGVLLGLAERAEQGRLTDETEKRVAVAVANHVRSLKNQIANGDVLEETDQIELLGQLNSRPIRDALNLIEANVQVDNPFEWDRPPTPDNPVPVLGEARRQRNRRANEIEAIMLDRKRELQRGLWAGRDNYQNPYVKALRDLANGAARQENLDQYLGIRDAIDLQLERSDLEPALRDEYENLRAELFGLSDRAADRPSVDAPDPELEAMGPARGGSVVRLDKEVTNRRISRALDRVKEGHDGTRFDEKRVRDGITTLTQELNQLKDKAEEYKRRGMFNERIQQEYKEAVYAAINAINALKEIRDANYRLPKGFLTIQANASNPVDALETAVSYLRGRMEDAKNRDDLVDLQTLRAVADKLVERIGDTNELLTRQFNNRRIYGNGGLNDPYRGELARVKNGFKDFLDGIDEEIGARARAQEFPDGPKFFKQVTALVQRVKDRRQQAIDDYLQDRHGNKRPWAAEEFNVDNLAQLSRTAQGIGPEADEAKKTLRKWARGTFKHTDFVGRNGIKFKTSPRVTINRGTMKVTGSISAFNPNTQEWEQVGKFRREINLDGGTVYNAYMAIGTDYAGASPWARASVNNSGFASIFNPNAFVWYKAAGFKSVGVTAGLTDGPYVWGRMGFRASFIDESKRHAQRFKTELEAWRRTGRSEIIKTAEQANMVAALIDRFEEVKNAPDAAKIAPHVLDYSVIFDPTGADPEVRKWFIRNGITTGSAAFDLAQLPER